MPSGGVKTHLVTLTRDASRAYGVHLLSNTVTQFHPRDATVAPRAVMPGPRPEGNALSSDERTLFVANRGDDTLVEIDTDTMTCGRRVKTRSDPNRIYRTSAPDGRDLLLLTNSGRAVDFGVRCATARGDRTHRAAGEPDRAVVPSVAARRVRVVPGRLRARLDLDTWRFVGALATLRGSMRRTCSRAR